MYYVYMFHVCNVAECFILIFAYIYMKIAYKSRNVYVQSLIHTIYISTQLLCDDGVFQENEYIQHNSMHKHITPTSFFSLGEE